MEKQPSHISPEELANFRINAGIPRSVLFYIVLGVISGMGKLFSKAIDTSSTLVEPIALSSSEWNIIQRTEKRRVAAGAQSRLTIPLLLQGPDYPIIPSQVQKPDNSTTSSLMQESGHPIVPALTQESERWFTSEPEPSMNPTPRRFLWKLRSHPKKKL
jgi:hypothetical protein